MLYKMNREVSELRKIKTIQPYHWTRTVFPMIVVVPCWSQYNITPLHSDSATMHGSESALTFDDETHGESNMPMRRSRLVWHNKLKASVNSVRGIWCFCTWVNLDR